MRLPRIVQVVDEDEAVLCVVSDMDMQDGGVRVLAWFRLEHRKTPRLTSDPGFGSSYSSTPVTVGFGG
jgi:hypothetical protein